MKAIGKNLFNEDLQQVWNKLNQISEILDKQTQEIKHLRRDISDLDNKLNDIIENDMLESE